MGAKVQLSRSTLYSGFSYTPEQPGPWPNIPTQQKWGLGRFGKADWIILFAPPVILTVVELEF